MPTHTAEVFKAHYHAPQSNPDKRAYYGLHKTSFHDLPVICFEAGKQLNIAVLIGFSFQSAK